MDDDHEALFNGKGGGVASLKITRIFHLTLGSSEARGGSREPLALCDVQGTSIRMLTFPAAALTRTSANPCLARASGVEH